MLRSLGVCFFGPSWPEEQERVLRLGQGRSWEATSFLWIKSRGLGRGNRLLPVRTFWMWPPSHHGHGCEVTWVVDPHKMDRSSSLAQPQSKEHAPEVGAPEGWRRGGAARLCMRTKTHRRKWCAGVWLCEDLPGRWRPRWPAPEQERRRRRWQRRSWEGASPCGQVPSGGTGVGGTPTPCRQRRWTPLSGWPGRTRTCWGSGCERFRDEHPPLGRWEPPAGLP